MPLRSVNPFSLELNGEFDTLTWEQCLAAVAHAREAYPAWSARTVKERAECFTRVAGVLREESHRYGRMISREMGKPIGQSVAEVEKCAFLCDYYGENAEKFLTDEDVATEAFKSYVTYEPLGVILGIMPWNFPFWQVFRFAVPVMAAGNVVLLKHASNVPRAAMEIEKIFRRAELPRHVFQSLLVYPSSAERLIEEDLVDGVSLTGSVEAGSKVGEAAGRHIRKVVLELGGSDPFMILEDADLDKAARVGVQARFMNAGQSCIAAKRFLVMKSVYEAFLEKFVKEMRTLKLGDPLHEGTDMGPLARGEFIGELEDQLADARKKGAQIIAGPSAPEGRGYFFSPVAVTGVTPSMRIFQEEVFGPIAPILAVETEEEMVRLANDTEFGLGASIWTRNIERGEAMARKIRAGFTAINDMVKSDPRLPFGGIKRSGIGRELSHFGMEEFTNPKTVVVQSS